MRHWLQNTGDTRQAFSAKRVADTPRRYAWFAPDVTAPIFSWVGAAASLLSNGHPSDIGQARPALHARTAFVFLLRRRSGAAVGRTLAECMCCAVQQCHGESLLLEGKLTSTPLSCCTVHAACAMPARWAARLDEPETLACLARQLYLGHSSAGTESAGPPTAKTIALTAPLPQIQTNSSWAAQCSSCVGTTGVAAAPSPSASAVTAHKGLCAKCGFSTVRRPLAEAHRSGVTRQWCAALSIGCSKGNRLFPSPLLTSWY